MTAENGYRQDSRVALYVDTTEVLARGLRAVIDGDCPHAWNDKTVLKDCIQGERLRDELLKVDFVGANGRIAFSANGDLLGKFIVNHVKHSNESAYHLEPVAVWTEEVGLTVSDHLIEWNVKGHSADYVPDSACSRPCGPGQIKQIQDPPPCCWICLTCRENQVKNSTSCASCPEGTWPDSSKVNCLDIRPEYLAFPQTFAVALVILASVGLISCVGTFSVWIVHRNDRLIKASSKELSLLVLSGLLLSFTASLSFLARPSFVACVVSRAGFHVRFTITYAPLLMKTTRICRIFELSKRNAQMPAVMGNKAQVSLALAVVAFQV